MAEKSRGSSLLFLYVPSACRSIKGHRCSDFSTEAKKNSAELKFLLIQQHYGRRKVCMNKEEYAELNSKIHKMIVDAAPFRDTDPAEYSHRKQEIALLVLGSRLIRRIVNSFRRTNRTDEGFFDDLYQEGCLAVIKTIDNFRISSKLITEDVPKPPPVLNGRFNIELLYYEPKVYRVIPPNYNFLWLAGLYAKKRMVRFAKRSRSLVEITEDIAPYLAEPDRSAGADPESMLLAREAQAQAVAGLTEIERQAVEGRMAGRTLKAIAMVVGISIEGVRKAEARAIQKLAGGLEVRREKQAA